MKLLIAYKNGTTDEFSDAQLDCSSLTIKGHALKLIQAFSGKNPEMHLLDGYNSVNLSEIISIRVI